MNLPADVLEEIQYRVVQGFDNRAVVFDWILANYPRQLGITAEQYSIGNLDADTHFQLRDAIERAFENRATEIEAWPSTTDCDRLGVVFDALDRQGIIALENAGLTQADGIPYAADIACVRDELGQGETHGYCFFTWNDLARAIDGDGLSLAYGTFKDEAEAPADSPPTRCPVCGGRGWIAATDPRDFPTVCSCQAAPSAPLSTPGQRVGAAVLEACQNAGLKPEWSGSPDAFVELPGFNWQRRMVDAQESHIRDFLDSWELELRAGYTPLDGVEAVLAERAGDWFEKFHNFGPPLLDRLRVHTAAQFLEAEQHRESAWSEPTINDRITAAFAEMNQRKLLARECLGLTIQDGWGYAGLEAESDHRGVVFFHHEDVMDGVNGRGLLLAFGAIGTPVSDDADEACLTVGRETVAVLRQNGVPCEWNGSAAERIRILPFKWCRRRWTTAPVHTRDATEPGSPKSPSLLSRIFGRLATSTSERNDTASRGPALDGGVVVRAFRDEGGFNVRRSRELRASWTAQGHEGEPQAGHIGLPHVFIRAGGFTSMAPLPATANAIAGAKESFLRAANLRRAREA